MSERDACHSQALAQALAARQFLHVPGPNPILRPGPAGSWDNRFLEACDLLRDRDTYYLYYHGTSQTSSYQVGCVTATHPLGPFRRVRAIPVLPVGPAGSWDESAVACALLLKEASGRYLMWYSGLDNAPDRQWSIGLAYAEHPLGPWTKCEANPLVPGFGYVGGVVLRDGLYHLYTEHPIGARGPDYGPFSLATAPAPEGPWTVHSEPILHPGEWGEWDDGGFSEAKVYARDGICHVFYGGAKLQRPRLHTEESIGYAYSLDGVSFVKHPANPVAPRQGNPDAAAFAEVHAYEEPPFIYLYHTLRYYSNPDAEHLGVQVLATQRPFRLTVPLLAEVVLSAGQTTALAGCPPLALGVANECSLTVSAKYAPAAQAGLVVHVRASGDGSDYDTEDLATFTLPCRPGETVRATFRVPPGGTFLKVLIENPDPAAAAGDVTLRGTVGG